MIKKLDRVKDWYKRYGLKLLLLKITDHPKKESVNYTSWLKSHSADDGELERQSKEIFGKRVTISVAVPVYHTPEQYLCAMIESVQKQSYSDWELCIADGSNDDRVYNIIKRFAERDKRIKIQKLEKNLGIADNTNAALRMCTGEYIGLLDHDDLLAPEAFYEIRKAIQINKEPEIIYTDEDKVSVDGKIFFEPHFKSDFNQELLCSNNYICHFFVVKREVFQFVGGLRKEYEGAQDYDFILRCTETTENIIHIAKPLYHWRSHMDSTAENPKSKLFAYENGKKAIEAHLKRQGERGYVEFTDYLGFYQVNYELLGYDRVSIVLFGDTKLSKRDRNKCIVSIKKRAGYDNFDIYLVNSLDEIKSSHVKGKYILLLNKTVSIITQNWLLKLLGICQRKEVGAVGIKLYNKNETIRHAGIILGMQKYAFEGMPRVRLGYFHRDSVRQNLSAVTVDCMMLSRSLLKVLEEKNPNILANEIKLCEEICNLNQKIVYDPGVEAYISGKSSRAEADFGKEDIYYNRNLDTKSSEYEIKY